MPSITIWNRIEPRARALDPQAGLEARVHDPLWLLARQWQIGEFEGRDTGSPVSATLQASIAPLDRFAVGTTAPQVYDAKQPIEALIERESVRPVATSTDLRQATEAGLYFLRLLDSAQLPSATTDAYRLHYSFGALAQSAGESLPLALAGRGLDGIRLHKDLQAAGSNLPSQPAIPAAQHDPVFQITRTWLAWYSTLFSEPAAGTSNWSSDRMEYQFTMGAAGDTGSYVAKEYDGAAVEWYTFDRASTSLAGDTAAPATVQKTVIATPVTFRGMPARRFWEMEDASANIGMLSAAAEDLGRLLLREFALIYSNDWFQFPLLVPVGSLTLITSLSVADTFGVNIVIPHYTRIDGGLARWRMFAVSANPLAPPVLTTTAVTVHPLVMTPGAVAPLEGAVIEDVLLLRDELANMAWGIERTVVGDSGQPLDRTLLAHTSARSAPPPGTSVLRYRLGSDVPDYWLPLLPVALDAAGHLRLRRGRLPATAAGAMGRFLGDNALTIFLEEIPREGVHLERRYRWARGADGSSYLWIGRRRSVGQGEGRSGLHFDFLE